MNLRKTKRRLFITKDGLCHFCGTKTIWNSPNKNHIAPNLATIDHLYSKNDIRRYTQNSHSDRRKVLCCYKCNQEKNTNEQRALLKDISPTAEYEHLLIKLLKQRYEAETSG